LELIDKLRDEWERVMVLNSPFIELAVVIDRSEGSTFLFDKKEGSGIGTF